MQAMPATTPFDERALAHLLDFRRNRAAIIELPPEPYDAPMFEARIPTATPGDKRGAEALAIKMSNEGVFEINLPLSVGQSTYLFPCYLVNAGPFGTDELVLTLRVAGQPRKA